MSTIISEVFIFAFKFFNQVGLRLRLAINPTPALPLARGGSKNILRQAPQISPPGLAATRPLLLVEWVPKIFLHFLFSKPVYGRGFIYSLGRDFVLGITAQPTGYILFPKIAGKMPTLRINKIVPLNNH